MNITLHRLVTAQSALARLMMQPLKARTAFALGKVARLAQTELEAYETTRKILCERLGTLNEDGTFYEFGENLPQIERELSELLSTSVELDVPTVTAEALGDAEISGADLLALDWLIVE